jgi:hypothetical protein
MERSPFEPNRRPNAYPLLTKPRREMSLASPSSANLLSASAENELQNVVKLF